MARLPTLLVVLVAAVAAAGCLASSGPGGSTQPSAADAGPAPGAGQGANASGGAGANATASGNGTATTWRNQTRRGSFTGARVVFGIFGRSETFSVPQGTRNLTLVIRAPDVDLTGSISPPCDSDGFSCPSTGYETSRRYVFRRTDPAAGDWDVSFFRDETGAGRQRYILKIARQVPVAS